MWAKQQTRAAHPGRRYPTFTVIVAHPRIYLCICCNGKWVRPVQPPCHLMDELLPRPDILAAEIGFMCSHATSAIKRVKDELVWSVLIPSWI
jgi:hypothetical protein